MTEGIEHCAASPALVSVPQGGVPEQESPWDPFNHSRVNGTEAAIAPSPVNGDGGGWL